MSEYTDLAMRLRAQLTKEGRPVYHCSQAVACAFAQALGYDEAFALRAAACFRGGMQIGSVCGAVTGGLMALGLGGADGPEDVKGYLEQFRSRHDGMLACKDLLRASVQRGEAKKAHCDALIAECVQSVEEILRSRGRLP